MPAVLQVSDYLGYQMMHEPTVVVEQITATTGPNGEESWFNCGIEGSGWTPPPMNVSDVVSKDLNDALSEPNSPFSNCGPYVSYFYQYASQYGGK